MSPSSTESNRPVIRAILLFALVLAACTCFLGDIGVYNDDFIYNLRDPATGEARSYGFDRPLHVWRPLLRHLFPPVVTLLWPHPWMLHALSAVLHGAITAAAFGLLRRLGIGPGIAGPCALAFMVLPTHFEAVLWIAATCTLVSILLVLASWHLYLWWIARSHLAAVPARLAALTAFGGMAWCAAALNEQPAGALVAMPITAAATGLAAGQSRRHRIGRTALPVVATALALLLYLRGFRRHTPGLKALQVAENSTLSDLGEWARQIQTGILSRLWELTLQIPGEFILVNFIRGAWRQGVEAIGDHPWRALLIIGGLAVLAAPWCWSGSRRSEPNRESSRPRPWALVLLGSAWSVGVWIPVAAAHSHPYPRLFYPFDLGVMIGSAGALAFLVERIKFRGQWPARVGRFAFALAICAAITFWIGVQDGYQRRFRADVAEVEPLARTFAPTIEPGSMFIPVHLSSSSTHTDVPGFDRFYQHCWRWPLAAGWRMRLALRNPDVHTICTGAGAGPVGLAVNPRDPAGSVIIAQSIAPPKPAQAGELFPLSTDAPGRVFAWDRLVLFDIEGAGNTVIYTRVRIHTPVGEVIDIVPRQVSLSPEALKLPERVLEVFPSPRPPNRTGHQ